jgi:hypothetical protein
MIAVFWEVDLFLFLIDIQSNSVFRLLFLLVIHLGIYLGGFDVGIYYQTFLSGLIFIVSAAWRFFSSIKSA